MTAINQSNDLLYRNHEGSPCDMVGSTCDMGHCQKPCVRSIDSSNDYIMIFNSSLRLININSACSRTLKDETMPRKKLLGNDIFFFVPEFKEPGVYDYYNSASFPNDIYVSEDYQVKAPVNKDSIFVKLKITKYDSMTVVLGTDITNQKMFNELTKKQENRLNELVQEYNNLKIALNVLLKQMNEKTDEIEKNYFYNLEETVFPMLDILKATKLDERQATTLDILESNLRTVINPFTRLLNAENCGLTQREIQIAHLIRSGKTTKEITNILFLSCKTVDFHRANIRKKLNINNTRDNLRSTLLSIG